MTKTGIVVNANQTSSVDAQLEPGGQQVSVDVVSEAGATLQTEAPVRGGNISTVQITQLPINLRNPVCTGADFARRFLQQRWVWRRHVFCQRGTRSLKQLPY